MVYGLKKGAGLSKSYSVSYAMKTGGVCVCSLFQVKKKHLNWLHIQVSTKKCVTAKNILRKALIVADQLKEHVLWSLMYCVVVTDVHESTVCVFRT